ncbi:uncharacterized protein B0H64DRAFT_420289 [Chaetomium fimeti]|uniref:Uncharacterized protein n=1 Tax=Chaetomium fimeti TaxID=1854472 RepID=A0AAE0LN20_9PEZI|nr:hypothetical protein B0H64DRAFT_420289 [Chaetomium fimeti]
MSRSAKKQEEQIRQVQALAFEGIGGDSWAGGDDSTARADLENLHSRLKSWAKKYAIEEMSEVRSLAPDEYGSFIQLLTQVVPLHGPGTPNDSGIEHLESGFMNRKSPVVCIQGLLSHHVYAKVISKPFFALGDAGEALQNVHRAIRKVNETESHIWRSRTLRLLATSSTNVQQQGSDGRHNYIASQKAVCHHFASEFYNGPAKHLIKSPTREGGNADTQCFNDLESIVQYAGELSYRLWTRRTLMSFMSLPDLYNQPFRMGSDIMKAHPLHKLYEDDGRCDGWFVGVVAHPAVLAFGSSDGKDYNSGRVWMQAEVWLTEDDGVKK